MEQLIALRDAAEQELMTLVLPDGRVMDVLWRHFEGAALEVYPVTDSTTHEGGDFFDVVLHLMEWVYKLKYTQTQSL